MAAIQEPRYDAKLGALGTVTGGALVIVAEAGPDVVELPQTTIRYGAMALAGIGSAF